MNSLTFAIEMERQGEQYYRQQAANNGGNGLQVVFNILADEEVKHAELLEKYVVHAVGDLQESKALELANNVFSEIKAFENEYSAVPQQLDAYRAALAVERRSIELYRDLHAKAESQSDKDLFAFLTKQEEDHYSIVENLVILIRRPQQWVESAEFGVRKEY